MKPGALPKGKALLSFLLFYSKVKREQSKKESKVKKRAKSKKEVPPSKLRL